jgi:SecD/SecF fusion protein
VALVARFNIDFMGNRRIMFAISAILIVVSIGALSLRGLKFGIEFEGGTVINVTNARTVTSAQVRAQTSSVNGVNGFIIRTDSVKPEEANASAAKVAKATGLPVADFQVTTIGPGWGKNITNSAVLALALSIAAILLYVSLRFEYKMSITAVVALVHDLIITLGVYSLAGLEVTPNTVAALLTILGFSLYDTIVVFHRVKENSQGLVKQTFMSMANESINEVFIRSVNTTLTSLIPVVVLLFFGGSTLKDFAFALSIGLFSGAYSSIGVAAPLFAVWKETEPKYKALAKRYANAS